MASVAAQAALTIRVTVLSHPLKYVKTADIANLKLHIHVNAPRVMEIMIVAH